MGKRCFCSENDNERKKKRGNFPSRERKRKVLYETEKEIVF